MSDFVLNLIKENAGTSATLFVVLVFGITYLAYKFGQKKEKIDSLPCESHKTQISDLQKDFNTHIKTLSKMEGQLTMLVQIASNASQKPFAPKKANNFSRKQSPRVLNENGLKIYELVKGKEFIETHKEQLFNMIDLFSPKTPYDVEMYAFNALRLNQSLTIFDKLKSWVYNEPSQTMRDSEGKEYKSDITLDDVLFVISLPLRDLYLDEHPEINQDNNG